MEPCDINPETKLCTIIGTNAQIGVRRRFFNTILKEQGCNATAVALNVKEEQLPFMMQHVKNSKITHMIVEPEFSKIIAPWCGSIMAIDYLEIANNELKGFCLDGHFLLDGVLEEDVEIVKMAIIAHNWFQIPLQLPSFLKEKYNG